MEFALGMVAALIGATGAFVGAWTSGRHQRRLEHERWLRSRDDAEAEARATAITETTRHLASALQSVTWFTSAVAMRPEALDEGKIADYNTEIRENLRGIIQGLVAVAHRDRVAFLALEALARRVWTLDWRVAQDASEFWSDPELARAKVGSLAASAAVVEQSLPHDVAAILWGEPAAAETPAG